ncbi:MAG: RloB family protein [Eubacteriales bacterium]|nr:RloB family protein [Eubacteriales bacterium]
MSPVRTYTDWNKRSSDAEDQREPFRKYFFICEGLNTEVWYFRKLIDMRKQLGIHPMIDIRLMEKTGEDESLSNPKALIEFAEEQKQIAANEFDCEHDKMVVVFDADIYKNKADKFKEILELGQKNNILAVTNPSFELFLLLHYEDSYEEIILPNSSAILENKKIGKRRFMAILFTEKSGMNPKENPTIGELAVNVKTAIVQEENLNQNVEDALGNLTCNVGKIIKGIMDDEV